MNKIEKFGLENVKTILKESKSLREVLNKIGYETNGSGGYQTFKRFCKINEIIIPKYNYYGNGNKKKSLANNEVFIENSSYSRQHLKERIIKQKLIEYKCDKCGNKGEWMNEKLSLQLDHKNGVHDDNRLKNLCFLCPNCHTQTTTYSAKNRKTKKNLNNKEKYYKVRKVKNRPTYEQLLKDVKKN